MISRRNFLKQSIFGAGIIASRPWINLAQVLEDWPDAERLGRNCTGGIARIRTKPSADSPIVKEVYEDYIFVWLREVVGEAPAGVYSSSWVETPEGYVFLPAVQPVKNLPNQPVMEMPQSALGPGFWAEVTVPYVDIYLDKPPSSPWLQEVTRPRLYYSQVMWISDVRQNADGETLYRVGEKFGSYGDEFWAAAEAFRPISEEEIAPIHTEIEQKKIVVNLFHQTLSCYEDGREVYFCKVSTGSKFNAAGEAVDAWSTPPGPHPIFRKLISLHMSGGSTGAGWDTPGIGWTSLFAIGGVAIHSTFWHNAFGMAKSHGCVNTTPDDAKWIFRWSYPHVSYVPGDLDVSDKWPPIGTIVEVVE